MKQEKSSSSPGERPGGVPYEEGMEDAWFDIQLQELVHNVDAEEEGVTRSAATGTSVQSVAKQRPWMECTQRK